MNDLSEEMPEKLTEMTNLYEEWAAEIQVVPWDSIQVLYDQKRNN
jgi:hypothetical protein